MLQERYSGTDRSRISMKRDRSKINQHVATRIRQRRVLSGITQQELANRLGLTYQQVSKYCIGTNRVTAGILHDLAEIFNVDVSYFFEGMDEGLKKKSIGEERLYTELSRNFHGITDLDLQRQAVEIVRRLRKYNERRDDA